MKRLNIFCDLLTIGMLFPAVCLTGCLPSIIKIQQSFKEGDTFTYIFEDVTREDFDEESTIRSATRTKLIVEVPRVRSDGTVDIIIKKCAETLESNVLKNKIDLGRTHQEQVSFKILPNGEIPEKRTLDRSSIRWGEIILRNLPPQGLRIGETFKTDIPFTTPQGEKLRNKREFTILGFEKCKGYDCVKIRIASRTMAEKDEVLTYLLVSEKEVLLAYRKGFFVVQSHRKLVRKYATETNDLETDYIRVIDVELVAAKSN